MTIHNGVKTFIYLAKMSKSYPKALWIAVVRFKLNYRIRYGKNQCE